MYEPSLSHMNHPFSDAELIYAARDEIGRMRRFGHTTPDVPQDSFDGYSILRELKRGGQGVVYEALQHSTKRKVAIKVMKEGPFAGPSEKARFEQEIVILGRLAHPHIVNIHDSGIVSGFHYFVMDYIRGQPLDVYMTSVRRSIEDTLRLFIVICDAVQTAHLLGITHRDLKPSNIRVDESGRPRILDFGLAKLATEATPAELTATGQFVGSLPWAAPEQAAGSPCNVTPTTDVYALGVILFQMLTARFPYDVSGPMSNVVERILTAQPIRPRSIRREVTRDLETVVFKALQKDRFRRYSCAGDLGRDLRHCLAHEPIEARRDSKIYLFRKFVRRHRGWVIAGAVVASSLLMATGVSVTFGIRAERQRAEAEQARDQVEQVAAFQQGLFSSVDAATMGARFRADLLERVRASAEQKELLPEEIDAHVEEVERLLAGTDFTGMALESLQETLFQPGMAAIDKQFADQPLIKARLLQALASTLHELGLDQAAAAPQEQALTIRRNLLGEDNLDTLASLSGLGALLEAQRKLAEAETCYLDVLEKRRRILGENHPETLDSTESLAGLLHLRGNLDQAEQYYRETLEKRHRVLGDDHSDTLSSLRQLGGLCYARDRYEEAEEYCRTAMEQSRKVLGPQHPDTLASIQTLAMVLAAQEELAEAESFAREALEGGSLVFGDDHPTMLSWSFFLGKLLRHQGKLAEAEPYWRHAADSGRRMLTEQRSMSYISSLGSLLEEQGKLQEAEQCYVEALEKYRRALGDEHPGTLSSITLLGGLLHAQGRSAEALSLLEPVEPVARRVFARATAIRNGEFNARLADDRTARLAQFLAALGRARAASGRFDEALYVLEEALDLQSMTSGMVEYDSTPTLKGFVELFEAWDTAEPGKGYDDKAAEWRQQISTWCASTQPAAP